MSEYTLTKVQEIGIIPQYSRCFRPASERNVRLKIFLFKSLWIFTCTCNKFEHSTKTKGRESSTSELIGKDETTTKPSLTCFEKECIFEEMNIA